MTTLATLLLADGRFPAGAVAHSGGLEEAVNDGRVHDLPSLAQACAGRLHTVGRTDAALAAATVVHGWGPLVAEADARMPSPVLRAVSRRLGRLLLRTARGVWPLGPAPPVELPYAVALGTVVAALGGTSGDAALLAAHGSVMVPAAAAIRLLGVDPTGVFAAVAALEDVIGEVVAEAVAAASGPPTELPGPCAVLLEIAASTHLTREVRLFAS